MPDTEDTYARLRNRVRNQLRNRLHYSTPWDLCQYLIF